MKRVLSGMAASAILITAAPAWSADIDTTGGVFATCHTIDPTFGPAGQIFTIPAGETLMTSVSLGVTIPTTNSTLTLYPISGVTLGAPIASTAYSVATVTPNFEIKTIILPGGGLPVAPGETYAILAEVGAGGLHCLPVQTDVYPDGSVYQNNNGPLVPIRDAMFRVTFATPPTILTLSEWAMILFGLALAGAAAWRLSQRRWA